MTREETYEAFDAYLNGTIDDPSRRDLERRLKENTALRDDFELYRAARQSVTQRMQWEESSRPFLDTLDTLSKEHFTSRGAGAQVVSMSRRRLMLRLVSAAAVLLLVVLVWQPWQKDLYSQYAHHPRAEFTDRNITGILPDGARAFNKGDYAKALELFSASLDTQPDDPEVSLYAAISALELGQTAFAKARFRELSASPVFSDEAAWYMALTYLKEDARDSTRHYLSEIRDGSSRYVTAQQLLTKLK